MASNGKTAARGFPSSHTRVFSADILQGWAKEWSLGLQFFSSCMLRHRLSAGCVATKLNKKYPNLGTTL